jgi:ubiquinone/menaquinone biosynthesis C-methylase UbiE
MYARFLAATGVGEGDTILDVGVTSDTSYSSSNYLEAWYPHKAAVTALGIDDAQFLEQLYPGMRFVKADALALPFADKSFDVVHSSAVLEHVGSFRNQIRCVAEMTRVARRAVFLTTPNRWFPVEFHTSLPLVHWLPKPVFRAIARGIGLGFFASEDHLNLLTRSELSAIAAANPDFALTTETVPLAGWPSNLLLFGRRRAA